MSRTFQNENISRQENQQDMQDQQQSYRAGQGDIGQYTKNISTLERGGNVGANPWMSADYLANQNRLTSNTVSGENAAAKQNLVDLNQRTGGRNTGATIGGITQLAGGKMRMGNELNAQRAQEDFGKNVQYQQYLAGAPMQAASAEGGLYGTATQGEDATESDLTKYGIEQMQERQKNIEAAEKAATAAATMGVSAYTGGAGFGGFGEGK